MEKYTVLVTGAGAPGIAGTIYSLKNNPLNIEFRIITTDIKSEPVGKYLGDKFFQLPSPEADNYFDILSEIIKKEKVDVVLPQTTKEIEYLSKNLSLFKDITKIVVSDYDAMNIANNKCNLLKISKKLKIPYPEFKIVHNKEELIKQIYEFGYNEKKVVIKPCFSNGMRGVRIITEQHLNLDFLLNNKPSGMFISLDELKRYFKDVDRIPPYIVQEYLPGDEYTIDIFRDTKHFLCIPRKRNEIRSGISFSNTIELREDLIHYSKTLAEELNLNYCFGFQFKLDENGIPKILESNPRVQGTMVASTLAGANIIFYAVASALNLDFDLPEKINIVNFQRYWGGVGLYENKLIGKI